MTTPRDFFECEYARRHMGYDPRSAESKIVSVNRLRDGDRYSDAHVDLCWRMQIIKNSPNDSLKVRLIDSLEW